MSFLSRKQASQSGVMFTNAVYYTSDTLYAEETPGQLDFQFINMVYYAHAKVAHQGFVLLGDEYADVNAPCDGCSGALGSLDNLKQQHEHLQVLISIGGMEAAASFPAVAANGVQRDNFARSAAELVSNMNLEGVDINWLYPADRDQWTDFVTLLSHVRMYLPAEHFYVTATLPADKAVLQLIDVPQLAEYVDHVNLAAFDMHGPWSPKCGHHAPLYAAGGRDEPSGAACVHYLVTHGLPAKKILLGVPLYGRSFLNTSGPGHRFRGSAGTHGIFSFRDLPRPGTREEVDRRAVAAKCVGGDGGFVSYDNPETVREKADFGKQKGLAGLYYYSTQCDAKDPKRSLVAAGYRRLHGLG